uniref:Mediator of RNA polymerase II transcription subunit 15a n=2 Tax=Bursaphelenchus xylophilus TaxID=6326 RepID=A0A1I7RMD6_BURXY
MQMVAGNLTGKVFSDQNSLKRLLGVKYNTVNELMLNLIESEWRDFIRSQFLGNKGQIPSSEEEKILQFARISLQHVLYYTKNVIQAARLKKSLQNSMKSEVESSPDVMSNMSSYGTPLTPGRASSLLLEPSTPESKILVYNDQTPGAGASEVARRAIQKAKAIKKPKTIEQVERLRRSVIILTGDWPASNTRHATVIEIRVGSLHELVERLSSHNLDWSHVGQVMLFCDAAWFLPQCQVPHEVRQYALNKLIGIFHDRAPDAKIYLCEPVPLVANVQLIENMNSFIDFARAKAAIDPL